jgi:hypothetical protein
MIPCALCPEAEDYLIAVQAVENVVFNCVPILSTAVRIAIEMVPAMRAYGAQSSNHR